VLTKKKTGVAKKGAARRGIGKDRGKKKENVNSRLVLEALHLKISPARMEEQGVTEKGVKLSINLEPEDI